MNAYFVLTIIAGSAILTALMAWITRWPERGALWLLAKVAASALTLWGGVFLVSLVAMRWFAK